MAWDPKPGGTSGGIGEFLTGIALVLFGFWMLASRVVVVGGRIFGGFLGDSGGGFALLLLPLGAGVTLLFRDSRSRAGWPLVAIGVGLIAVDVLTSLHLHFRATPLPIFLGMIVAIAAGIGLIARSLRPHA